LGKEARALYAFEEKSSQLKRVSRERKSFNVILKKYFQAVSKATPSPGADMGAEEAN